MTDDRILQDAEIKISKHTESIRVLFSTLDRVQETVDTLRVDLQSAVREVSALESHVHGNSQRTEKIMNELSDLVKSVAVASANIDNVETAMGYRKEDDICIASMRERCNILTEEIQRKICEVQTVVESLRGRVTELEYETVNDAVQLRFSKIEKEMKALNESVSRLQTGEDQEAGVRKFLVHALPIVTALVGVCISVYVAIKN